MKKILLSWVITTMVIHLAEARNKKSYDNDKPVQISAKWKTGYKVKKLYTTPLGAVYEFARPSYDMLGSPHVFWHKDIHKNHKNTHKNCDTCKERDKLKKQFYSIQTQFFKSENALREKYRRYVVIDFKVRLFPVKQKSLERKSDRLLSFVFWTSAKLNQVYDLTELDSLQGMCDSKDGYCSKYNDYDRNNSPRPPYFSISAQINPYKVHSYRIIYDTVNGSNCIRATNCDGIDLLIQGEKRKNMSQYPIKSIGIFLVEHKVKDRLLEFSDPVIRQVNTKEELKKLASIKQVTYPYDGYFGLENKNKRTRNPDEIYARAMRSINGNGENCDLVKGMKLLREAARKKHVFAMYQLGVCYYRGIGVPVDYKLALEWLRKAENEGVDNAKALKAILLLRQAKLARNDFFDVKKQLKSLLKDAQSIGIGHNLRLASLISMIECVVPQVDYTQSPKLAYWAAIMNFPFKHPSQNILDQQNSLIKQYGIFSFYPQKNFLNLSRLSFDWIDLAVARNFTPAMYLKGMILCNPKAYKGPWTKNSGPENALAIFKQGAALGNINCQLQTMLIQAGKGKLSADVIQAASIKNIELLNKPLYYLIKYSLENKDQKWSKAFLNGDISTAQELLQEDKNDLSYFLSALIILDKLQWKWITYRLVPDFFNLSENKKALNKAFELLSLSAKAGNVSALYLLGKFKLEGKFMLRDYTNGIKYLKKSAEHGHLGAHFELAKEYWKTSKNRDKVLKYLKKPCLEGSFSEAWLLVANVWKTHSTKSNSCAMVLQALKKSAALGNPRAWHELGVIYYYGKFRQRKDIAKANQCWIKFLKLDSNIRNQDLWDMYWGKIEFPKIIMDYSGLPMSACYPCYDISYPIETQKEYYNIFK